MNESKEEMKTELNAILVACSMLVESEVECGAHVARHTYARTHMVSRATRIHLNQLRDS